MEDKNRRLVDRCYKFVEDIAKIHVDAFNRCNIIPSEVTININEVDKHKKIRSKIGIGYMEWIFSPYPFHGYDCVIKTKSDKITISITFRPTYILRAVSDDEMKLKLLQITSMLRSRLKRVFIRKLKEPVEKTLQTVYQILGDKKEELLSDSSLLQLGM